MKNICKTCNYPIETNSKFCANCGAKIVNERLSLKGTWNEFIGPFFSWDNNFWRTFKDLFTNPKKVLEAYVGGARKKYFQPFSYLILFTTNAIFFYKIFPIEITNEINQNFSNGNNVKLSNGEKLGFNMKSYTDFTMNYYNFVMILMLPLYAITTYLLFNKRNHNFSEHLVFNSYLVTNLGYIGLILQLIMVQWLNYDYMKYSYFYLILMVFYTIYAFKDLYLLNFKQSLFALIKYLLWFFLFYILFIIVFIIVLVIYIIINGGFK